MVEFPYVFHSASHDTIILCGHGTFIKANPIMLLTSVQSLFKFYQFFTNVFFSVQGLSRVARCISLSYLLSFIQSVDYFQSLSFMTLTFWKNTDQLFCRVSFHLDLSNIF